MTFAVVLLSLSLASAVICWGKEYLRRVDAEREMLFYRTRWYRELGWHDLADEIEEVE